LSRKKREIMHFYCGGAPSSVRERVDSVECVLHHGSIEPANQATPVRVLVRIAEFVDLEGTGGSNNPSERVAFDCVYLAIRVLPEGLHEHLQAKYRIRQARTAIDKLPSGPVHDAPFPVRRRRAWRFLFVGQISLQRRLSLPS
jgi:hypothetical protein